MDIRINRHYIYIYDIMHGKIVIAPLFWLLCALAGLLAPSLHSWSTVCPPEVLPGPLPRPLGLLPSLVRPANLLLQSLQSLLILLIMYHWTCLSPHLHGHRLGEVGFVLRPQERIFHWYLQVQVIQILVQLLLRMFLLPQFLSHPSNDARGRLLPQLTGWVIWRSGICQMKRLLVDIFSICVISD